MKYLLKGGLYVSFLALITLPVSYLIRLILTRNLTLEEYGFIFAVIGFFDLIQSISDFGFSEAQVYFLPKYLAQKRLDKTKAALKVQLINQTFTTLVIAIILNFSAPWLARNIFHFPEGENIIRIMVIYFIATGFLIRIKNIFFSFREVKIFGSQETLRMVLTLSFIWISILFYKLDLTVFSWIWILTYAILAIYYFILFIRRYSKIINAQKYPLRRIYREYIPFLIPILLSNNLGNVYVSGTETLLVVIKGVSQVGLYNIAKPISNMALALTSPVASLLKPYISEISGRKIKWEIKDIITIIINSGSFLLLPIIVTLVIYAKESIVFLFGKQFDQATLALQIITIDVFFLIMSSFLFSIVFGLGLQKGRAILIFICSVLNFGFALILIPMFGFVGLSLVNLSYSICMVGGALYLIRIKIPFKINYVNYLKIIASLFLYIGLQSTLRVISAEDFPQQFLLFVMKAFLGLLVYYWFGIKILKIINIKEYSKLLEQSIPSNMRGLGIMKKILGYLM